jgi:single-strand DNA-binding protein
MYHRIEFIGNVGRDPELRFTPDGKPICGFSVASSRTWKNAAGEAVKETIWFNVTVWGPRAEIMNQYIQKGKKVFVEGRLKPDAVGSPRVWKSGDGEAKASFDVTADNVVFLSRADGSKEPATEQSAPVDDDMPF